MIAVDSSVAIAAFATWHEEHRRALAALDRAPHIVAHAALETYSVLTRMPRGLRVAGGPVADFLAARFEERTLTLAVEAQAGLPQRLRDLGIEGGAVYDALIAMTAGAAGASLVTLDERAARVYGRCAVETELIAGR